MITRLAALAGVLSGCLILALGGGEAPAWLRCLLVLFFGALALLYGFTAFVPGCPRVLTSRPVVGVLCVWAGAGVMWVPPNVVLSGVLIGFGTRCLMLEAGGIGLERVPDRGGELATREWPNAPARRAAD